MEDNIFSEENKQLFSICDLVLRDVYMKMLKHLNRYHRAYLYVPKWTNNAWDYNTKIRIQEVKDGYLDNREIEKILNIKENVLGDLKYKILFEIVDMNTKMRIAAGISIDRKDFFGSYINSVKKAVEFRKQTTGCDIII